MKDRRSVTSLWRSVGLAGVIALLGLCVGIPPQAAAQSSITGTPGEATERAVVELAQVARQKSVLPDTPVPPHALHRPLPGPRNRPVPSGTGSPSRRVLEPVPPPLTGVSPAPASSFLGLDDNNASIPPDTHGAVGLTHLMVTLNTQVRIQDRTGGVLSTVSLNSFWASLSSPSAFDPKVLYDPYQNRWMFTACANARSSASSVLIGVSQTSDPTGTWNLYRVDADPDNAVWADYPSLGFNKDWIVVQVNMFTVSNNAFVRSDVYVFDKADLYAGGTGRFTLMQDTLGGFSQTPAITYDPTVPTMYLVEDWNGDFEGSGYLRLSTITGPVGAEVLTLSVAFPSTSSPWDSFSPSSNFAPQLGSTQKIDAGDSRMQNTLYRNGSLWCAHTVFLPAGGSPARSAVQWWRLTPDGAVEQQGRIDDTAGPTSYAYPSIAVNRNNDVLIGFSRFSATQYASANYAFRAAADPAGTFRTDAVLKAGEASYFKDYGSGTNRWGDYSSTVVDPVNDTDLWTIQEYAATPASSGTYRDRWGTWWGQIVPPQPEAPPDTLRFVDTFAAPGQQAIMEVRLSANHDVSGLQFAVQPTVDGTPTTDAMFTGLINSLEERGFTTTFSTDENGLTTVLFFSTSGDTLRPGQYTLGYVIYTIAPVTPAGTPILLAVSDDVLSSPPPSQDIPHAVQQGTILIGRPGDVGGGQLGAGDGRIDIIDVITEVFIILGRLPRPAPGAFGFFLADINGDGAINILDVVEMIYQILNHDEQARVIAGPASPATVSVGDPQTLESGQVAILGTTTVKLPPMPAAFALRPNRPNPFNPTTQIVYDVPQAAYVTLTVYNLLGQEVIRLVDAEQAPGRYEVAWDGRNVQGLSAGSGVYLYRLTTSTGFSQTHRMTLVK
ncbi:MAG: T9SS type A sorting domain-containing protein [Candidatus Latescibacteria bacterium]|nr:T9SS type A sorting domain-containing protein [Candidatus Latescibacterota bacterium]